jgi:hypothetical protein
MFFDPDVEIYSLPIRQPLPKLSNPPVGETTQQRLSQYNKNFVQTHGRKNAYTLLELQQIAKILGIANISNYNKATLATKILELWEAKYT